MKQHKKAWGPWHFRTNTGVKAREIFLGKYMKIKATVKNLVQLFSSKKSQKPRATAGAFRCLQATTESGNLQKPLKNQDCYVCYVFVTFYVQKNINKNNVVTSVTSVTSFFSMYNKFKK